MNDQFFSLTPERMLDSVELALNSKITGIRATGRCLALNSMENRVYEIELEDNTSVVTKFYRPGRWTKEAILEEHEFISDLKNNEIPAVAPLKLSNDSTLFESQDGIYFAIFSKVRGRILQELDNDQLSQIGRLLGRLHNIGKQKPAPNRLAINPTTYGWNSLDFIEKSGLLEPQMAPHYKQAATRILKLIDPIFQKAQSSGLKTFRIHGDCHLGNVLWQDRSAFFLDFDDMLIGPAVQDVWLVVRGRGEEAERQREVLIRGYEQMREFEWESLHLVEPLRTLRMIHYSAWIARRWQDPTFKNAFPDFGSQRYWQEQTSDLIEQEQFL